MTDLKPARDESRKTRRKRRRAGSVSELRPVELARWLWRQLTSMRTALILLLLLALAAIPGSLIPQVDNDSLKTQDWQAAHTTLTPIYDKLGLFKVFETPWFAAIYILLMISLIGCIVPRLFVYWRGLRAQPPATPRNLTRLPDTTTYSTTADADEVLARARQVLRKRRYRLRRESDGVSVSAERGYLREAGNLVFHLSIILVLVGFAMGGLLGYKGGVIVLVGKDQGFSNNITQYDDFDPGSLFSESSLNWFRLSIEKYTGRWIPDGSLLMGTDFHSHLSYQDSPGGPTKTYDLQVNHPLDIGGTEVFLIGHGYAPEITVRDGRGKVQYSGPTVFLPQDASFVSFGVVKVPYAQPSQLGFQGLFYPYEQTQNGQPVNLFPFVGKGKASVLSLQVYRGNLGLDLGAQSVYSLDTTNMTLVPNTGGKAFNLHLHQTVKLPDGLGSVTFTGIRQWNKLQISKQPGRKLALIGVSLALVGLLGSLFIRPRRVWVRAVSGAGEDGGTLVEVAALDRSGGGDIEAVVTELVGVLQGNRPDEPTDKPTEENA